MLNLVKEKVGVAVIMRAHSGDRDDDPLPFSIFARDHIFVELYDPATRMDKVEPFSGKISVRSSMVNYRLFRITLVDQKTYSDLKIPF